MNCRNCATPITEFFSLGLMPPINTFLKKEEIAAEKKYPLRVAFCPTCYLAQLIETIPPEDIFRDYIYFSSTSSHFVAHCKEVAALMTKKLGLTKDSLVLEVASNDGPQLQAFKDLGIQVLGVDPAENIAKVANERGIRTIPEFFNHAFAKKLKAEGVRADAVFGANVLAHVPEIVDFAKGLKEILTPKGTAVFEFPYLKGLMENKFDTIYHEHVFYYSLLALQNIFKNADLEVYDVHMTQMQGGSLMIFIANPEVFPITENIQNLEAQELDSGFDKLETYQKINANVSQLKSELMSLLENIKKEGKKVAAYSAPAKGNILLNYFGINENYLDFIVDKSPAKQNLYTPGTHMLVHPLSKISEAKPDYLIILCWNIANEVIAMEELKEWRQAGGKFIIPIPSVTII